VGQKATEFGAFTAAPELLAIECVGGLHIDLPPAGMKLREAIKSSDQVLVVVGQKFSVAAAV
jgi:hypothetical protein